MFKHPVVALVSAASVLFFLLTQAANLIAIVHLPADLREALIAMSQVPTLLAWGILAIGAALIVYLIIEHLKKPTKPLENVSVPLAAPEFVEHIPDIRVADHPAVLALFAGVEADKLIPLLEAEKITAWARPMGSAGDPPPVRLEGKIWRSHHLVFLPRTADQTRNQTFIRKNSRIESIYFDVHLNKAQIKGIWSTIDDPKASSSPATHDTPIARAVAHVRAAINDLESDKCFPATCKAIRQAALVPRHRGFDRLSVVHRRSGRCSGSTSNSMLRAILGFLLMNPARSSVNIIW